ncbi:hypothetical protein GKE82_24955 [Conexibacter sp. W3-3-2]|uniref:hypothetical protein n=1 Tax=Conexibacter sp. W3-3-2 TaxID=2675227 RepID=UPI0012B9E099|nr:hypothetical protein [Conexibacter sp. W3-3-2]MTD47456.1 hypothetical protein [Conexibacter sp. W3-3-2]
MFGSVTGGEVVRWVAMLVAVVLAVSAVAPVGASAQGTDGSVVSGSGFKAGSSPSRPSAESGSAGFGDIAKNTSGTVKTVASVLAGIALIVAIGVAWAQTSVKTLGFAVLMAILASMAISGKLWTAAEDTGKDLGGTTGSVVTAPPAVVGRGA